MTGNMYILKSPIGHYYYIGISSFCREYHGNPTNLAVKAGSDNSGHIPIIQIEEGQELNVNPYKVFI